MSRFFPQTLSRYLAQNYALGFLGLTFILLVLVYVFDTVELLRRASKFDDISVPLTLLMGLLKLPEVGQIILPFAVLFSAMIVFTSLSRRSELVIFRAAGLSAWQFLGPVIGIAALIGVLQITVINPFGALALSRFVALERVHLDRSENIISFSGQGLWLRQDTDEGYVILHAGKVAQPSWALENVMALFYTDNHILNRRVDAPRARLDPGQWVFEDAIINMRSGAPEKSALLALSTSLTIPDIEESFADPKTIPFWRLGHFIDLLGRTGFDPTPLQMHRHILLSQPLLLVAMVLLAAAVSLRPQRSGGTARLIIIGVSIGFCIFLGASFLQALGTSGQLPPILAAWFAPLSALFLGIGAILSLEDG